jgi:hypothetical protein
MLPLLRRDLGCWFINRHWCQLRGRRSAGALASNQLLSNIALKRDGKALIDLVDGLSPGLIVLVDMAVTILRIMIADQSLNIDFIFF